MTPALLFVIDNVSTPKPTINIVVPAEKLVPQANPVKMVCVNHRAPQTGILVRVRVSIPNTIPNIVANAEILAKPTNFVTRANVPQHPHLLVLRGKNYVEANVYKQRHTHNIVVVAINLVPWEKSAKAVLVYFSAPNPKSTVLALVLINSPTENIVAVVIMLAKRGNCASTEPAKSLAQRVPPNVSKFV